MLPYTNPYFFQQQQFPMQNPQSFQQTVPQPQIQGISGRIVDNAESISVNDVPMTGVSVFPKSDMSEVYVKSWNPNGTIRSLTYKAVEPVTEETEVKQTDDIMQRLTEIESKLDKLVAPKSRKASDES